MRNDIFKIKMSMRLPDFVVNVCMKDQQYTPQEVVDYISETSGEGFGNTDEVNDLKKESQSQAQVIVGKYELQMDQSLQSSSCEPGKALSDLVNNHTNQLISLIQKGAGRRGILI
ncbi:hypothetical protein GOV12_05550 [Candidatus Pacearchaeota archaeon]|nr:hypothetical protein [Candidatus Pacearchaeota archaeon]